MTASNRYIPIECPKCGNVMQLGDSEDTIDSDNGWDSGTWEEQFTCPQCQTEFSMNVQYDITITSIQVAYVEDTEDLKAKVQKILDSPAIGFKTVEIRRVE